VATGEAGEVLVERRLSGPGQHHRLAAAHRPGLARGSRLARRPAYRLRHHQRAGL